MTRLEEIIGAQRDLTFDLPAAFNWMGESIYITVSGQPGPFPPKNAAIAAQAIALSRFHRALHRPGSHGRWNDHLAKTPFSSILTGHQNKNSHSIAKHISRFTIGAVAAAAHSGTQVVTEGYELVKGVHLELQFPQCFYIC